MIMKIVYPDGSWIIGDRNWKAKGILPHETQGCHHFIVLDGDKELKHLKGMEVAVPINAPKYFILNYLGAYKPD